MSASLPTATAQPTAQKVTESPTVEPRQMISADRVNYRDADYKVIGYLVRGMLVKVIGTPVQVGNEFWQLTNYGYIDPKYIEVK